MTIRTLIVFTITLLCFINMNAQAGHDIPKVYSVDAAILAANKLKIKAKNPALMPAYDQLLKDAEKALAFEPVSVMEKIKLPGQLIGEVIRVIGYAIPGTFIDYIQRLKVGTAW